MSVETLILLALFIVLPLIRQLMQAMRQRNGPQPEAARPSPRPVAGLPPPLDPAIPPLPDARPGAAPDAMAAGGRSPASDADGPVTRRLPPDGTPTRRAPAGLHTRRDLRRAIVLVEMLGPCRASNPYDESRLAGRP